MSDAYQRHLDAARRWLHAQPAPGLQPDVLEARARASRARWVRTRVVLMILGVALGLVWVASAAWNPISSSVCAWVTPEAVLRYGAVHVASTLLAGALAFRREAGAQLVVRGVWWATLLGSVTGLLTDPGTLPALFPAMLLAAGTGLWLLSREPGLGAPGGPTELIAHRTTMTLVMILALSDLETLAMATVNHEHPDELRHAVTLGLCTLAMGAAVWGLYRLRTWGLALNLALNVAIAALGLAGNLFYSPGFAYLLVATAVAQLALSTPLLLTAAGLRTAPTDAYVSGQLWGRSTGWWSRLLIVALLGLGAAATVRGQDPSVIAQYCAD